MKFPQYNNYEITEEELPFLIEWICFKTGIKFGEFITGLELSKLNHKWIELDKKIYIFSKKSLCTRTPDEKAVSAMSEEERLEYVEDLILEKKELERIIDDKLEVCNINIDTFTEYFGGMFMGYIENIIWNRKNAKRNHNSV